jgi:hypothetical protein
MALSIKLKEKINKVAKEKKLVWMVAPYGKSLRVVSFQPQSLNIAHLICILPCRQI